MYDDVCITLTWPCWFIWIWYFHILFQCIFTPTWCEAAYCCWAVGSEPLLPSLSSNVILSMLCKCSLILVCSNSFVKKHWHKSAWHWYRPANTPAWVGQTNTEVLTQCSISCNIISIKSEIQLSLWEGRVIWPFLKKIF